MWEDSVNHDVWERFTFDDNPSGIVVDAIAPSKKVTRIWNSEGHEIYHIGSDEVVDIVSTQSEAHERVNELGKKEYYSKPVGTSGQATPDDRILMLKRVGQDRTILMPSPTLANVLFQIRNVMWGSQRNTLSG